MISYKRPHRKYTAHRPRPVPTPLPPSLGGTRSLPQWLLLSLRIPRHTYREPRPEARRAPAIHSNPKVLHGPSPDARRSPGLSAKQPSMSHPVHIKIGMEPTTRTSRTPFPPRDPFPMTLPPWIPPSEPPPGDTLPLTLALRPPPSGTHPLTPFPWHPSPPTPSPSPTGTPSCLRSWSCRP